MDAPLNPSSKLELDYHDYCAYDKEGDVYVIIRSTNELKSKLNSKTFTSPEEIQAFIADLTFMSYSYKGDFLHILLDNGFMSDKELNEYRLGDEPYTAENAKKKIERLILLEKLAVFLLETIYLEKRKTIMVKLILKSGSGFIMMMVK